MALHLIFVIVYMMLNNVFYVGSTDMNITLIVHCSLGLLVMFNRGKNFVTPLSILYLSCILSSCGNILVESKIGTAGNRMNNYMVPEYMKDAANIWCYGSTCMFIGFEFAQKMKFFPNISLILNKELSYKLYGYVLFLSIFDPFISDYLWGLGSIAKLLFLVGIIGIMYYARLGAAENDKKFLSFATILALIQTFNALTHSFLRAELILPTLVYCVGYFIGKGHIKYVFSYRIVPFAVAFGFFLSIFGLLGVNRSAEGENRRFVDIIGENFFSEKKGSARAKEVVDDENRPGGFLDRSANIAQLTNVVKLTKQHGFYDGEVSGPLLIAFIPRIFWPDKPQIVIGQWFAGSIGQGEVLGNGRSTNSINITIPGEGYVDFGWAGLIAACLFFGAFLSVLWNSVDFYSSSYNIIGVLYGGYILEVSMSIAADLQIVITYISTFILFFLIKRILNLYYNLE